MKEGWGVWVGHLTTARTQQDACLVSSEDVGNSEVRQALQGGMGGVGGVAMTSNVDKHSIQRSRQKEQAYPT